jgi:hypothetical protein
MKTKQQVFDEVVAHLREQRVCSMGGKANSFQCLYRGPNNTKCAVGALIPDSVYAKQMEGKNVVALLMTYPNLRVSVPEIDAYSTMLGTLQGIHDSSMPTLDEDVNFKDGRSMERVESKLAQLAKACNLTYTEPARS